MKKRIFYTFLMALAGLGRCLAQVPDSVQEVIQVPVFQQDTLPVDSLLVTPDTSNTSTTLPQVPDSLVQKKRGLAYRIFKSDYPNPKKALYLSIAFPAGGQIYNRRWWKPPIIWGGYVALIYGAINNTKLYKEFRDSYIAEVHNMPHKYSGIYNAGDLKRIRDGYDKNKQLSYIGIFALHVMQSAEAFVDCHLKTFDVSDDLSLRIKPSMEASFASQYPAMGIGVSLNFGK